MMADGARWTIEVIPRFPAAAEIVERATGVSMLATHAEALHSSSFAWAIAAE
jgi:predicted ATP-grasp superfamily ATP-dependent carboligase